MSAQPTDGPALVQIRDGDGTVLDENLDDGFGGIRSEADAAEVMRWLRGCEMERAKHERTAQREAERIAAWHARVDKPLAERAAYLRVVLEDWWNGQLDAELERQRAKHPDLDEAALWGKVRRKSADLPAGEVQVRRSGQRLMFTDESTPEDVRSLGHDLATYYLTEFVRTEHTPNITALRKLPVDDDEAPVQIVTGDDGLTLVVDNNDPLAIPLPGLVLAPPSRSVTVKPDLSWEPG